MTRRELLLAMTSLALTQRPSMASGSSGPPLWEAVRAPAVITLFGRMNVRADSVWRTEKIERAFRTAQVVWLETTATHAVADFADAPDTWFRAQAEQTRKPIRTEWRGLPDAGFVLDKRRNAALAVRLEAASRHVERQFVCVGLHRLIGPRSLPNELWNRGFRVQQLSTASS